MQDRRHRRTSFSYRAINKQIRDILDQRSVLDNTQQVAMPFVKATTTLQLPDVLGNNAIGFTLGTHANTRDFNIQDIYSAVSGDALIGYTYEPDASGRIVTKNIYANLSSLTESVTQFLDGDEQLYTDNNRFGFIPPPGITNVTVGTNRAGLTRVIEIDFAVPTLSQLEILHRTFLVPGVGMILEWGQQFAPKSSDILGEGGINSDTVYFPWYDHNELVKLLARLGRKEVGMNEIMEKYVYPSQGQYAWLFGRVGNFTTKANSDGSYDCTVKLLGQGEESWSYLTRTTLVRPIRRNSQLCIGDVNSVETYFTKTSAGENFKSLLQSVAINSKDAGFFGIGNNGTNQERFREASERAIEVGLREWVGHVVKFNKGNQSEGETRPGETRDPNTDEESFGEDQDAYFMTWRFFVNVVLNDDRYGLKSIFRKAGLSPSALEKISLLRPYTDERGFKNTAPYLVDPYENFVGKSEYLRSVDLGTLVIVNEDAAKASKEDVNRLRGGRIDDLHEPTDDSDLFAFQGDFNFSAKNATTDPDVGFLSTGVWLNHKAIVNSFVSANTILEGINNLLNRMNNATLNFWDLTIDVSEPDEITDQELVGNIEALPEENSGVFEASLSYGASVTSNYTIIDANYRENSDYAVNNFLNNVHTFNKYIRDKNGTLVGSDVIDCNVTLDMPKRLFSQISTLGLSQPKETAEATNVDEQELDDILGSPAIAGPDDLLRKMFAITSVSTRDPDGKSPDLTIEPDLFIEQNSICSSPNTQTTAGTGGVGQAAGNYVPQSIITLQNDPNAGRGTFGFGGAGSFKTPETQLEEVKDLLDFCNENCIDTSTETSGSQETQRYFNRLTQLTVNDVKLYQGRRAMFAVGKYQLIPNTFNEWVNVNSISGDSVFSEELQEQAGDWLIVGKRPKIGQYVNGATNITVEQAQLELAKEFASIPVPFNMTNDRGTQLFAGDSYYKDRGNNRALHTVSEVRNALVTARDTSNLQSLKEFIAKGEGDYNIFNIIPNVGDRPIAPRPNSVSYLRAINGFTYDSSANTFPPTYGGEQIARLQSAPDVKYKTDGVCADVQSDRRITATCEQVKQDFDNLSRQVQQKNEQNELEAKLDEETRQFSYLKTVFRYFEPFGEWMVTRIANDANDNRSNPFGAAPGSLSIKADITLPGIAGLRVGELFWIDRIPSFYRAFGAFQILSIEENVSTEGWTTKIHGIFNYLGNAWKKSMTDILREGTST